MKKVGVIVFSRLWPQNDVETFESINMTVNNETKTAYKVKSYPIIGINEDSAFGNDYGKNEELVIELFKNLKGCNGFEEVFLVLHDLHFDNKPHQEADITKNRSFRFIQAINNETQIRKAVLFQHENDVEICGILKKHLKEVKPFDADSFYEDLENYLKKDDIKDDHTLRFEILTPFAFLHTMLQLKQNDVPIGNLSNEEKKRYEKNCQEGIKLLENNGNELRDKFKKLKGISKDNKDRIKSKLEEELDKFIQEYKNRLHTIFNEISDRLSDNTELKFPEDIDNLFKGIEKLSKIIENASVCAEVIKKNRGLRHDIENAITRLKLFIDSFSAEKRGALREELNDLNSNLTSFDTAMVNKYFDLDMKTAIDESIKIMRECLLVDDASKVVEAINNVIGSLKNIVNLTLKIAPR